MNHHTHTKADKAKRAQKTDLRGRLTALTFKASGGAVKKSHSNERGVSLDPASSKGVDVAKRSERRPKGKTLIGRAASLANLKVGRPGERPKGPTLTKAADAATYVLLRASGVPPIEAVVYFAKGDEKLSLKQWAKLADEWESHALTKTAWDTFHGGEWQSLDDERRTDVALRHHLAQCAYILYTTDITKADVALGKVNYAKTTILAKIAIDKTSGGDDRFTDFLKQLTTNANAGAPAIWKGTHAHGSPSSPAQSSSATLPPEALPDVEGFGARHSVSPAPTDDADVAGQRRRPRTH